MTDTTVAPVVFWAPIRKDADSSKPFFAPCEMSGDITGAMFYANRSANAIAAWHTANPVIGYRRVQCTILPE